MFAEGPTEGEKVYLAHFAIINLCWKHLVIKEMIWQGEGDGKAIFWMLLFIIDVLF